MDPDEIYGDIDVPEDQNVEPKKKRKRKFHSSEYVSKKRKESHMKHLEKEKKEEKSVEGNDFGDVFKKSLQENVTVTPENKQPCEGRGKRVH